MMLRGTVNRMAKKKAKADRPLRRDDRVKIDADPEDALRALVKPRSDPRKRDRRAGR